MGELERFTPYADVNAVLRDFLAHIHTILGEHFRGMYLDGSLALGDFDPYSSDIDLVVTTDVPVDEQQFVALHEMHERFNASLSPWATEVEAVYIPQAMLRRGAQPTPWVPRIERGPDVTLVKAFLNDTWVIHWYIVREHGVAIAGPNPRSLIDPIAPDDLRRVTVSLADSWLEQARHDDAALRLRGPQVYMVRTLCRMLYTLDHGAVVSKPVAARWAQQTLDERWMPLITRTMAWRKDPDYQDTPSSDEIRETLAFIEYTFARCQRLRR